MAEATMEIETPDAAELAKLKEAARAFDRARMKKIAGYHFALVMGALTLWGAAEIWAQSTGWALARFVAVANALVAGVVIPSTLHEWGHFVGARIAGSASPVLDAPRDHFFMFDFKMDENDPEQFGWMSWGGIVTPWLVVLLAAILVPVEITSGAALFATLVSQAVAVSVFEVPIAQAAARTGEPGRALSERVVGGGLDKSRRIGTAVGVVLFLLFWLSA